MPTTITGAPAFTLDAAADPTAVLPAPGDLAAATVMQAASQRTLDYVASVAADAIEKRNFGVRRVKTVGNVDALKAMSDQGESDLVLLLDPTYTGGGSGLFSGVALFTFVPDVTWPQTSIPDVTDAWIVVSPTVGTGRWVNLSAGVGWYLGGDPAFAPRPARRQRQWSNFANGASSTPIPGLDDTYHTTGAELAVGLTAGSTISLDFDGFTAGTAIEAGANFRIEVSIDGGGWSEVPGTRKLIGGTSIGDASSVPVHLGGFYTAPSSSAYSFRAAVKSSTGVSTSFGNTWTARGLSFTAT